MHHQHHGCEEHPGIFTVLPAGVFSGSECLQGPGALLQPCSGMTHNILPSCNAQGFPPTLPSPGSAWCVCERGPNQSSPCFTGSALLLWASSSCCLFFLLVFFISVLKEAASWNYHKLPLSNDLLVQPTITAVSRPSEHS